MSRRNKKRTKRYSGENAKPVTSVSSEPVVHRYDAVQRGPVGLWWQAKKRLVRFVSVAVLIVLLLIVVIDGLINLL